MEEHISIPTGDIHYPAAVAIISVLYMIYKQAQAHGIKNTLLEYVPITGKGIIGEPGQKQ
ncbi:MAG: hypothetical protein H6766_08055 [Candidatus Peribacteria bacterium]|nr:MAG: hypothetical protein H6766_08055 [Candidatus Peribacteria bacterium]